LQIRGFAISFKRIFNYLNFCFLSAMSPIVTITLSPCIDKSSSVQSLIPEKKMHCRSPKLEPGGGGINIARAIKKLGGEATAVFPSGGYTGRYFNHLMEKENIDCIIIPIKNETRENIIVQEESTQKQYRFGMPGTMLERMEWEEILAAINKIPGPGFIVASGSLPPGVPIDMYGRFAEIAKNKKAKFIADTSGTALLHAAEKGAFLLKPNLNELCTLAGRDKIELQDAEMEAKKIIDKYPVEILVVSLGESGALLVTKKESLSVSPPPVKVVSTVGAGDSMLAGMVLALQQHKPFKEMLEYGVACGTAATLNPGTGLCRKEDADKLFAAMHHRPA
jgi:6-phosphofructokinase 2